MSWYRQQPTGGVTDTCTTAENVLPLPAIKLSKFAQVVAFRYDFFCCFELPPWIFRYELIEVILSGDVFPQIK